MTSISVNTHIMCVLYACRAEWWCVAISFSLIIFIYDELRKMLIRKYPKGQSVQPYCTNIHVIELCVCCLMQAGWREKHTTRAGAS